MFTWRIYCSGTVLCASRTFQSLLSKVASLFSRKVKIYNCGLHLNDKPPLSARILRRTAALGNETRGAGTDERLLCFITFSWFIVSPRSAIMHNFAARVAFRRRSSNSTTRRRVIAWSRYHRLTSHELLKRIFFIQSLIPRFSSKSTKSLTLKRFI